MICTIEWLHSRCKHLQGLKKVSVTFKWEFFSRALTDDPGESKIAQLDHIMLGEEDVLRLDVSVDTAVGVAKSDALQELPNDLLGQFFRNAITKKEVIRPVEW